jgi:hypothetical protein
MQYVWLAGRNWPRNGSGTPRQLARSLKLFLEEAADGSTRLYKEFGKDYEETPSRTLWVVNAGLHSL